jgi:hypothetical protein
LSATPFRRKQGRRRAEHPPLDELLSAIGEFLKQLPRTADDVADGEAAQVYRGIQVPQLVVETYGPALMDRCRALASQHDCDVHLLPDGGLSFQKRT